MKLGDLLELQFHQQMQNIWLRTDVNAVGYEINSPKFNPFTLASFWAWFFFFIVYTVRISNLSWPSSALGPNEFCCSISAGLMLVSSGNCRSRESTMSVAQGARSLSLPAIALSIPQSVALQPTPQWTAAQTQPVVISQIIVWRFNIRTVPQETTISSVIIWVHYQKLWLPMTFLCNVVLLPLTMKSGTLYRNVEPIHKCGTTTIDGLDHA